MGAPMRTAKVRANRGHGSACPLPSAVGTDRLNACGPCRHAGEEVRLSTASLNVVETDATCERE
eukprot:293550-Pleurochrysis_carterae.AAC.3